MITFKSSSRIEEICNDIYRGIIYDLEKSGKHVLKEKVDSHFRLLKKSGLNPVKILDEILFLILIEGEKEAVRKKAGISDPLNVRNIVEKYSNYSGIIRKRLPNGTTSPEISNSRKNIQCFITRQCNLRCKYCAVIKCDQWMDEQTVKNALDFLLSSYQAKLRMDFTGGEPLLHRDLIYYACDYGIEKAVKLNKTISFYMVTNATLMTRETVKKLKDFPFLLEISLDGMEGDHNKYKKSVEKALNPYFKTRHAIEILLEEGIDFFVVMVSSPENACRLQDNFEHIISLGVKKVDINYAIGSYWSKGSISSFLKNASSIIKTYEKKIKTGDCVIGNFYRRKEPAICNNEWMIDTDGSIHLMTEWIFQSSFTYDPSTFSYGNVKNNHDYDSLYCDKFNSCLTLLKSAGWKDYVKRKIILNNIETGIKVGKFFEKIKNAMLL